MIRRAISNPISTSATAAIQRRITGNPAFSRMGSGSKSEGSNESTFRLSDVASSLEYRSLAVTRCPRSAVREQSRANADSRSSQPRTEVRTQASRTRSSRERWVPPKGHRLAFGDLSIHAEGEEQTADPNLLWINESLFH
jgi:hypothetical protein